MSESNIFQIPRKVGYDMVFIDNSKGDEYLEIKDDFVIDRYEIRSYGLVVCGYNPHTGEKCEMLAKHYGETWFADRVQAEQKLKNV